jgi:hypothetical protein
VKPSLKQRLQSKLSGFAPHTLSSDEVVPLLTQAKHRINRETVPIPRLIPYLFCDILHYPAGQRFDKMHWSVAFTYNGVTCVIADEKFGVRFYYTDGVCVDPQEVFGKINRALRIIEKEVLVPAAEAALDNNKVRVANHFASLDDRYRFFRELAQQRHDSLPPTRRDHLSQMLAHLFRENLDADRELAHYNVAMIDAYFSRLEHLLVLALAFSHFDPVTDHLTSFVGANWGTKYQRILSLSDHSAKIFYDRMLSLKESFRNPF